MTEGTVYISHLMLDGRLLVKLGSTRGDFFDRQRHYNKHRLNNRAEYFGACTFEDRAHRALDKFRFTHRQTDELYNCTFMEAVRAVRRVLPPDAKRDPQYLIIRCKGCWAWWPAPLSIAWPIAFAEPLVVTGCHPSERTIWRNFSSP